MRLALVGFLHETNTFSPVATDLDSFRAKWLLAGDPVFDALGGSATSVAGLLRASSEADVDLVPIVVAWAQPSGVVAADAFARILDLIGSGLRAGGPWDGALLALHGAMVAEGETEGDAAVLETVRAEVGAHARVGAVLDMHANVSARMVRSADVLVAYQTNPHLDAASRAELCAALVVEACRGRLDPHTALFRVPLAVPILAQSTSGGPLAEVLDRTARQVTAGALLDASVVLGFPYADVPHMGASVLAVAEDRSRALAGAQAVGQDLWRRRDQLACWPVPLAEAVAMAGEEHGAAVILDVGDNVGAGAPGDSVALYRAAAGRGMSGILQCVWDPPAVSACADIAIGEDTWLWLGGRSGVNGPALHVQGRLRARSDGRLRASGRVHSGQVDLDTGPTIALDTPGGDMFVVTSRRCGDVALEIFGQVGVDPAAYRTIIAKGVFSVRPTYAGLGPRFIAADTPGPTFGRLERERYRAIGGPMWPFEPSTARLGGPET